MDSTIKSSPVEEMTTLEGFKQAIQCLRDGSADQAYQCLIRITAKEPNNPVYMSFLGLSLARAQRKWREAAELCEAALRLKRNEPRIYLNLAEVYISAGRLADAVTALDAATPYVGREASITRMREKLGKRRSPVLPFLNRQHWSNRSLGQLRHHLMGMLADTWIMRSRAS